MRHRAVSVAAAAARWESCWHRYRAPWLHRLHACTVYTLSTVLRWATCRTGVGRCCSVHFPDIGCSRPPMQAAFYQILSHNCTVRVLTHLC